MSKKKTHEEYVKELVSKNPNIKPIEKYIKMKIPIEHYCIIHDVAWKITPECALRGYGCPECKKEKTKNICVKTHKQYVSEVKHINQDIDVVGIYINAKTPIKHYCKKHNIFWDAAPGNILSGYGCPECGKEKSINGRKKTNQEYIMEVAIINSDIEIVGKYVNAHTPILHRCMVDGYEWMALPANIVKGSGCPECNESHGEKQIRQWLSDNNIEYVPQKTFNDCKNKKSLPFDFYLPDYNICIECQGKQHFEIIDYFGGEERFNYTKKHDNIKKEYCDNNNIKLVYIDYTENDINSIKTIISNITLEK